MKRIEVICTLVAAMLLAQPQARAAGKDVWFFLNVQMLKDGGATIITDARPYIFSTRTKCEMERDTQLKVKESAESLGAKWIVTQCDLAAPWWFDHLGEVDYMTQVK